MTEKKLTEKSPYKDKADNTITRNSTLKLGVEGLFIDKEEIKLAKELEKKYLSEYNIETISDKNLLSNLIYLEVIHIAKLQKSANEFTVSNEALPWQFLDAIHKNINQIVEIKEKLGLAKKEEVTDNALQSLELLKKKFKIWAENNQASRTLVCPHCSQMVMLKIRTDKWEAQKHPFFKDRLLGNEHLIRLYKQGKLTREDVASILGTSADYTDWLINKWRVDDNINFPSVQVKIEEVNPESSALPLTVDPIPTHVEEQTPTFVEKDVSPLNENPETGPVTE